MRIDKAQIATHPLSYVDESARLFRWRDGLYRVIAPERASFFRQLFESGTVQDLIDRRLVVDTELTDYSLDDGDLVLRHRELPFVSYVSEWPASMVHAAASTTLQLEELLRGQGLTLKDAHPWNVLFDGPRPLHVDFGSIVPATSSRWDAEDEFRRFFVNPLRLVAMGEARIARFLLRDLQRGTLDDDVAAVRLGRMGARVRDLARPGLRRLAQARRLASTTAGRARPDVAPLRRLARLRRDLDRLTPEVPPSEWSDYYGSSIAPLHENSSWDGKQSNVSRLLRTIAPRDVLDVAGNRGWYAQLAATTGARVVAFDLDELAVTRLHVDAAVGGLDVLPLVLDITDPTPGQGVANTTFPPATKRLKCELVLALALVHHLVLTQQHTYEQVAAAIEPFVEKTLVIEYVDAADEHVRARWGVVPGWYTLERFKDALGLYFRSITEVPSSAPTRSLLVCDR